MLEKITGRFGQPALGKGIDAFVEEWLFEEGTVVFVEKQNMQWY